MKALQEHLDLSARLKSKILVSVLWSVPQREGMPPLPAKPQGGISYSFDRLEYAVEESIRRAYLDHPAEAALFQPMSEKAKYLAKLIEKRASQIARLANTVGQPLDRIKDDYIDDIAKRFCEQHAEECVFSAPELWLPNLLE